MRKQLIAACGLAGLAKPQTAVLILFLSALPVTAQSPGPVLYQIVKEGGKDGKVLVTTRDRNGQPTLYVTVQFRIESAKDGQVATNVGKDEILVEEDKRRVTDLEIYQPRALDPLTVVLVLDTSGSMTQGNKLEEAKQAARLFLDTLHEKVDCGLILFDHRLRVVQPPLLEPQRDPKRLAEHRGKLRAQIDSARALGGTAYLDATAKAVEMLRGVKGRKAVLLLTDGVDLNSKATLPGVIKQARDAGVPIYTLGVGEPGKGEPVTTVLVLDHSGSMSAPAEAGDRMPKIAALHRAAGQFVELMRPGAHTTLLPFSTDVSIPKPFSAEKTLLRQQINRLTPNGETALFDAVFAAVETLEAAQPAGKRAVVALTDGIDNSSRRRVDEVIERAREARVPLHLLGLGRPGELDETIMRQMADRTGGEFHHAANEQKLIEVFEALSIQLHDDGFDHDSLTRLAAETGGKFKHARHASELRLYYQELAEELQMTYTVTFPSRRPSHDGTARGIDISVVRNGIRVSPVASFDYHVHGVVVPKLDAGVYLALLGVLGVFLAAPLGIRRLYRFYGGN